MMPSAGLDLIKDGFLYPLLSCPLRCLDPATISFNRFTDPLNSMNFIDISDAQVLLVLLDARANRAFPFSPFPFLAP